MTRTRSRRMFARLAWEWERLRWYGFAGYVRERRRRRHRTATVSQLAARGKRAFPVRAVKKR